MSPHGPSSAAPTPTRSGSDALQGRVLDGRYRIGDRIDRGGMATVYRALDLRLDREVAVKVMHPDLADDTAPGGSESFAQRLAREARAAARLSHPNVVSVHDQGRDHGPDGSVVWLVMELVEGRTLRDVVSEQSPLSPARALALLEPVVAALSAAHASGLVHRDVKPENVLLADDGRVKVADFGLARAVGADTRHTTTQGVLVGTVSYLAPELVTEGRADARADVYAVGVVLHELLTGVKPHVGQTAIQVAYRHVHHDVPAPSERVPTIPAYVDALVARATARDPELRPADAGVLLRQLRRVAHALADGVRDDPELVADLALPAARPTSRAGDTAPEAWADADLEALGVTPRPAAPAASTARTAPREHTRTVDPADGAPVTPPTPVRRPRRRRRGLLLVALAVVLALVVGGGAFWFGWARYSPAPAVVGLGQTAAERELETAGLVVAYADPVYDSDVRTGSVVAASPGAGDRVLDDDTVTLTLSLGPLTVPRVRDLDEDAAQDALLERQLDFGESIERYSEARPAGTVLASRPAAGTELRPGDSVDLVVSRGRRPIPIDDWVGQPADRAVAAIGDSGLEVETTAVFSDDVAAGLVVDQDPTGGALNRGDTVTLEVSQGPELVDVPRTFGLSVTTAQRVLEDAGFVVELDEATGYLGLGIAARTDPPAGSEAPRGSTITLFQV